MISRHSARFAHIMFTDSLHILFVSLSGPGTAHMTRQVGPARLTTANILTKALQLGPFERRIYSLLGEDPHWQRRADYPLVD